MFPDKKYSNIGEKCQHVHKNIFLNNYFHEIVWRTNNEFERSMLKKYLATREDERSERHSHKDDYDSENEDRNATLRNSDKITTKDLDSLFN